MIVCFCGLPVMDCHTLGKVRLQFEEEWQCVRERSAGRCTFIDYTLACRGDLACQQQLL